MHARGVLLSYETCIIAIVFLIDLKKSKVGLSLLKLKGNCNKGGSTPLSPHALHYKALIMVSICALIRARFALRGPKFFIRLIETSFRFRIISSKK